MDYFKEYQKKQKLIFELQRFYRENGRSPTQLHMQPKFGYPSYGMYVNHFGSWNNALTEAGLEVNQYQYHPKLNGTETCSHCYKRANEIVGFVHWYYNKNNDNKRYCNKCGNGKGIFHYKKGTLDINSPQGRGRAGEITVIKALKIGDEHDCALISKGYPFDLYHKEYKKINVKTSVFNNDYNKWAFGFKAEKIADTYICISMSLDTKNVEHVWIVPNENKIRDLTSFQIKNSYRSLFNRKHWEVDTKSYDEAWQEMLVNYTDGKCKVFK